MNRATTRRAAPSSLQYVILSNLIWFLGSFALAFVVWMVAIFQNDPVETWQLIERVPIRAEVAPGLVITNREQFPPSVLVQVQAQRSLRSVLAAEDIVVRADLAELGPGTHVIPLEWEIAETRRARVVNLSPSQISVSLEAEARQLVPVRENILSEPPPGYVPNSIEFDVRQLEISGPASRVAQVVAAQVGLELDEQRGVFELDARPVPIDADGRPVIGVNVEPQSVRVTVNIEQRPDVYEIRVLPPELLIEQLPEGYVLTSFDYNPKVILVSAPTELQDSLPDTYALDAISLGGRTNSFELTIPIELFDPNIVPITGQTITVAIEISAETVTRQFEAVPVTVIGGDEAITYEVAPAEIDVLITGPQPLLETLSARNIGVTVDVSQITISGVYQLTPTITIPQPDETVSITPLPAQIDVEVSIPAAVTATAEVEVTDSQGE